MTKWHLQNLGEDILNDINSKLSKTDIVDNLTSSGVIDKALSANQGKVLKDLIDTINSKVDDIVGGMNYLGTSANHDSIVIDYPNPENGDVVVVLSDETHNSSRTLYVYTTEWVFIGNFEMADEFIKLKDTPDSYNGQGNKYVRVSSDAKKLEFSDIDTYTKDEIDNKISDAIPEINDASTTQKGIVQLTNDVTGESESLALTQKGAKQLTDEMTTVAEKLVEHMVTKASNTESGHVTVDNTSIKASSEGEISVVNPFTDADKTKLDRIEEEANKYILPIATEDVLGGVKIDGETITINDGVIRASTTGDFRVDNTILYSKKPSEYLHGKTISILSDHDDNFKDWSYYGVTQVLSIWSFDPWECRIEITTDKTDAEVVQKIDVFLNQSPKDGASSNSYFNMFTITRISNDDLISFKKAHAIPNIIYNNLLDSSTVYGVHGAIYFNYYRGALMSKRNTPKGLTSEGWQPISDDSASFFTGNTLPTSMTGDYLLLQEGCHFLKLDTLELYRCRSIINSPNWTKVATFPKIVNRNYSPVIDDESIYSAYAVNSMITELGDELSTNLDNHISQRATTDALGHVKVDGDTIESTNGEISVKNPFTAENKSKLDGVATNANNYTLPVANINTLGGVKQGEGIEITVDGTLNVIPALPLISNFTTTIKNTPYKHYIPSIPLENDDYIVVIYNGLTLNENTDWEPEVITQDDGIAIKLMIDESDNDDENIVYGTIFRGFGKIV